MTDQIRRVTEGRRTEGAPPARESLYRELVRNANSAIIRWRVDGTITFFNEYAEAFFGWSAAEVVGKHVSILVPEQESTGADLTDLVRDIVARPEKYVNNVNENVCRDGRRVWMTWTNKPIRDDQGSVTEILAIGSDVTALKQAETSLRASEQRLLLALEAAFLISFEWDIQRNQVRRFVSQEPALAATPQQKPGTFEDVLAVVHPNDRELFQANVDAALQSANGHYESQFRIVRPDGEIAWLHERGRVERDGQGRPWRLIGLSQEITDRKQAEAALRQSREDLERAQAVGKIGWWRLDTRRNVLTWSAENHRIFGVPEGTPMSYESFLAIVHPDDRRYVDTQWQASLRGEPYDIEHRIVADDEVKWLREKAYLQFDDEGHLLGGFGITQDITEQKRSEEALRRSERRLSMALSATADAVWEWHLDTGKTYYSPRWYEMLGYDGNEISMDYDGWKSLCHPDDLQPTVDLIQSKLQSGIDSGYSAEFRMRAKDGSWVWILGRGRVVERDAMGRPLLLSGTNTDITARKHAEERAQQEHRRTAFANRVLGAFVEYEGDTLFDRALAVVQEEMASRHGVFGYIAEPGHLYCPSLSKMLDVCEIEGKCIHYPPDKWKGLWARALTEKRSIYTNEAPPVPPGHPIIRNNLAAPILFHGDVIGLLNIANKDGGYTDADRDMLDGLADRIAPVLYAWIQKKLREDERRKAEKAIRESRATLLSFYDSAPFLMGIAELDGDKTVAVSGNRAMADFLGMRPEDLPGRTAIGSQGREEIERLWVEHYRRSQRDGVPVQFEYEHPVSSGISWLSANVSFIGIGPSGRPQFSFVVDDITDRKRAESTLRDSEERLKASLSEKEVLLKEIHHRVKNNMQVISSLVDLQAAEVVDSGMCAIFQDVVHRVRSMAMVHEKLYQSQDLARVEFADYTETLLGYLWRSHSDAASGIGLDLNLKPVYLPVNQAVPCGLVLNELVGNALKHAFRGRSSGRVTVTLGEDGAGRVRLQVRDDGVGLPAGLDWRKAPSLGLRLVQMLSRQLKAAVTVTGETGTAFTLTFENWNP